MNIIQLYTCGLDSMLGAYRLKHEKQEEVKRVYFNLNSVYSDNELAFLQLHHDDDYYDIITNLNVRKFEAEDAYVPNRNLLLVTLAQSLYDADKIYINGNLDDRVSDNNVNFYGRATGVLSDCAGKEVIVTSILGFKEKTEWCQEYVSLNTGSEKFKLVSSTYSCFSPEWVQEIYPVYEKEDDAENSFIQISEESITGCLKCPACYRRLCAISGANMYVPFNDIGLPITYPTKINQMEHPNRYQTSVDYASFIKTINNTPY